jgi:hypothetical protein
MTVILPPTPGEDVQILAPHARLRGHVTGRAPEARVAEAREEPSPTIELELTSLAEPVERREHERVRMPVTLEASVWTLAQPTRRLSGNTVDLSVGGALLWLPELSPRAVSLDLTLRFPGGPVHATAEVRWRRNPALVGVQFTRIAADEQVRLVEFLRQQH